MTQRDSRMAATSAGLARKRRLARSAGVTGFCVAVKAVLMALTRSANRLIVELKAAKGLADEHTAQLLGY